MMPTASGRTLARLAQQLEAGHLRHALVGDDHRDVLCSREDASASSPPLAVQDVERLAEVEPEGVEVVLLVVDDQDGILRQIEPLRHEHDGNTAGARTARFGREIQPVFAVATGDPSGFSTLHTDTIPPS